MEFGLSDEFCRRHFLVGVLLREVQTLCACTLVSVLYIYILLHDWEGNTGEYSVRGWQYWPERSEGQYRSRELNIPRIARPKGVQ